MTERKKEIKENVTSIYSMLSDIYDNLKNSNIRPDEDPSKESTIPEDKENNQNSFNKGEEERVDPEIKDIMPNVHTNMD